MNFQQKLKNIIEKNNSLLCVGLDPDLEKFPSHFPKHTDSIFSFNHEIIEATHDLVCAYKPNIAFYEAYGIEGLIELKKTIDYLHDTYPEIPIILDAKRGDIGSTAAAYAKACFEYYDVDAVTVNPYLGLDSVEPFLEYKDKGVIVLCRTSNKGAVEIQDLQVDTQPLYDIVAKKVASDWNKNDNCLLVVGATYPQELKTIREIVGDMFVLVPGIGAQGGDLENTLKNGLTQDKSGLIISSSRAILYASNSKDFAEQARAEAEKVKNDINTYR